MKNWVIGIALLWCCGARAEDISPWAKLYRQVEESYVSDVTIEQLAVAALKGLKQADRNLNVGDDNTRMTLYYRGRVVKVESKPKDDSAAMWGALTDNMIAAAEKVSDEAERRNFEINGIMAREIVKVLDKDSKFYESMDEASGLAINNHRQFAARMEEKNLYIKIGAFNKQTKKQILEAVDEYKEATAMIIDLRGCPGGMLGEAIEIADLFLDDGIIASIRGKNTKQEVYYVAKDRDMFSNKPIVILVDGNSASAAEVLAVALQEQGRAYIIGTKTKGKGTIQKLIDVYPSNGVLAVTSGFFMTPSGRELNHKGIVPDVCTFGDEPKQSQKCPAQERENSEAELEEAKKLLDSLK